MVDGPGGGVGTCEIPSRRPVTKELGEADPWRSPMVSLSLRLVPQRLVPSLSHFFGWEGKPLLK